MMIRPIGAKKKTKNDEWKAQNTAMYSMRVLNSTGIPASMKKVNESGITTNAYITSALREKLIRDGFLQETQGE